MVLLETVANLLFKIKSLNNGKAELHLLDIKSIYNAWFIPLIS